MTLASIFQEVADTGSRSTKVKEMSDLLAMESQYEMFLDSLLVLVRSKDASTSAPVFVFLDALFASMDASSNSYPI